MKTRFPYAFFRGEKVERAFARVLDRISLQLGKAVQRPADDALHEVRTLIKLLRALLWLAKPALPKTTSASLKKQFRAVALALSGPRDAIVLRSTLLDLVKQAEATRELAALQVVAWELTPKVEASEKVEQSRQLIRRAALSVRKVIRQFERAVASVHAWKFLRKRLKRAFARIEQTRQTAEKNGGAIPFHEWRKKAKRLLYLLQVLESRVGRKKTLKRIDKIQNRLGEYHDSVVLEQKLRKELPFASRRLWVTPVIELLRQRKRRLRRKAEKVARRLA